MHIANSVSIKRNLISRHISLMFKDQPTLILCIVTAPLFRPMYSTILQDYLTKSGIRRGLFEIQEQCLGSELTDTFGYLDKITFEDDG